MVHRKVTCNKIIKGSIFTATHNGATGYVRRAVWGNGGARAPVPLALRGETEPLAPSSLAPPHPRRTSLGRQLRAHSHGLSRLARHRGKGQVGGALFRLSRACGRPPSLNSGSETAWLCNLHTFTAELSKAFLPFLGLLTLPVPWAGTQAVTFVELTGESADRDGPG